MPSDKHSPLPEESPYTGLIEDQDWHDHERPAMSALTSTGSPLAATQNGNGDTQISVSQRMLSATAGSILTSLLGTFLSSVRSFVLLGLGLLTYD
jgi:hypothetical protein